MSVKKKVGKLLKKFVTNSQWYQREFMDCEKFWKLNTFSLDNLFIGTDSGHFGCNLESVDGKSYDLTLRDSTIHQNYEVLRNYSSYIKEEGATVVMIISPFDILTGNCDYFEDRFYSILNMASIPHFSYERRKEVLSRKNAPLAYYPLLSLRIDIPALFKKNRDVSKTTASQYISHIKHRYSIKNFKDKMSLLNQDSFDDAFLIIKQMNDYCEEHSARFILSFPPASRALCKEVNEFVNNESFVTLLQKLKNEEIIVKDFTNDARFEGKFSSELFLNKAGALLYTKLLLF